MDPATLSITYRLLHLLGMGVLVGGAVVVAWSAAGAAAAQTRLLDLAVRYERLFWPVLAIQVLTGVGNIGALGQTLPGPATAWGGWLALKFIAIGVVVVASLVRTFAVAWLVTEPDRVLVGRGQAWFGRLYWASATLLAAVVFLAVRLAHG